jgi:hypothetical protein
MRTMNSGALGVAYFLASSYCGCSNNETFNFVMKILVIGASASRKHQSPPVRIVEHQRSTSDILLLYVTVRNWTCKWCPI